MTDQEKIKIEQQDINVIKSGRNPSLKVLFKNKEMSISGARKELITDLEKLALRFEDQAFINAIKNVGNFKKNKFNHEISFHDYGIAKAKKNSKLINSFTNIDLESCEKEASDSLKEFDKINQEKEISFDDFIETYNSKI
jgi:hypothetical protein